MLFVAVLLADVLSGNENGGSIHDTSEEQRILVLIFFLQIKKFKTTSFSVENNKKKLISITSKPDQNGGPHVIHVSIH